MGVMAHISLTDTIDGINAGFGSMLGSIGFPIGFGIILGQLVSDSGGANVIADRMVKLFPESKAIYAVAIAAFILSIPVFFDVTFVILIPIGVALMKRINRSIAYIVGAISIGAGVAHTLVPPTPNPLAAAEIFHFDLGMMILGGTIIGLIMVFIAVTIYCKILDRGIWNKDKDETGEGMDVQEMATPEHIPSFGMSLVPILLPVVIILLNTVTSTVLGDAQPEFISFLGTKTMALLLGVLAAYAIAVSCIGSKGAEKSASEALKSAGIVFLITGAGGSFAKIIALSGVNDAIVKMVSGISGSFVVVLLIAYILGLLFRQITGSGTVASLTTMTIMASVASLLPCHPVFLALACLDGALFGATLNDSGFWIVSNMTGLTFTGGAKTYTLGQAVASVTGIVVIILAALGATMIF
jgi:H+/gluconate symporter-like permease